MKRSLSLLSFPMPPALWLVLAGCSATVGDRNKAEAGGADGADGGEAGPVADDEVEDILGESVDYGPALDAFFAVDRLTEISLELDPADWAMLSLETRSYFDVLAGDCMAQAAVSPYTWFDATVHIDGEQVDDVQVRKKGFIGSLSTTRPGLKVDFDNAVSDRRYLGLERLILNNTPQDETLLRTCLAYAYFRKAGVPAPRCGFAHLTVNGEDYGVYANVEAVDDHFVTRTVGDDDVPLFEGTLSDLREGWSATYDLDSDSADLALLAPLVAAVESEDVDQIAAVIDLDAYVRFWVAEVMLGHWDGYAWNTNNYYVYLDPDDGKARFLPWGPDAALSSWNPGGGLDWIAVTAALPRALTRSDQGEALYRAEAERQLAEAWDEDELEDLIDTMADTISPVHVARGAVGDLKSILRTRDDDMVEGLAGRWPSGSLALRDPFCMRELGTINLEIDGTWGSFSGGVPGGTCSGRFSWEGTEYTVEPGAGLADDGDGGLALVGCINPFGADQLLTYISMPRGELVVGDIPMDHSVHRAALYYSSGGSSWDDISWIEGTLHVDEVDMTRGGAVRASFEGTLWSPPW